MTAKQVIAILLKNGWKLNRINGSHHVFEKEGRRSISVPVHGNTDIGRFAQKLLKEADIH
jgi:predicted RNA binding protein YcfA (HicA-like mRNA interferase family)